MNLANKYNIAVALKSSETAVLTIVSIDERKVRNNDGEIEAVDYLTGKAEDGTTYSVRLNTITVGQLVRLFGPETDEMIGRRVLVAPFVKNDRCYTSFAAAPRKDTAGKPLMTGEKANGTCPTKPTGKGPQLAEATKQMLAESARVNGSL